MLAAAPAAGRVDFRSQQRGPMADSPFTMPAGGGAFNGQQQLLQGGAGVFNGQQQQGGAGSRESSESG